MNILSSTVMRYTLLRQFRGESLSLFSKEPTLTRTRTGLGKFLMKLMDVVGSRISDVEKVMLTCFLSNQRALEFYRKLGFETDENSPPPRVLRNGTKIESDYVILSRTVQH
jgi:hypothetical protein